LEALEFSIDASSVEVGDEKRFKLRQAGVSLSWDPVQTTAGFKIDGNVVTSLNDPGVAVASIPLQKGVSSRWELEILQMPSFMSFGVVQQGTNTSTWHPYGFDDKGWGWGHPYRDLSHFSHNASSPGTTNQFPITQGVCVSVLLSSDNSLTFYHNETLVGVHPLKPTGDLYPAVALNGIGSVKLISYTRI